LTAQNLIDVTQLMSELEIFADKRDWRKFHSPKNLAMALTGEVGELVEIFQWLTEEQSRKVMTDEKLGAAVRDELADVLIYLVRLASVLEVDVDDAVRKKIAKNKIKYPPLAL
jgi:dCTP diphosphatase